MGAFTKVSHWSHGFQVKVLYLDDSVQIHNRMEITTSTKLLLLLGKHLIFHICQN